MRVDQVGSLLRPVKLKAAFLKNREGSLGEEELRRAQDEAIRDVIATQEDHHLPVVTPRERSSCWA